MSWYRWSNGTSGAGGLLVLLWIGDGGVGAGWSFCLMVKTVEITIEIQLKSAAIQDIVVTVMELISL